MERNDRSDQEPQGDEQSVHPIEPAEGAREPGQDANERRSPHPVEPAEGSREPED